jgi:DNA ligase 1
MTRKIFNWRGILLIMDYSRICGVYDKLEATSKGLEKTELLASFLGEIEKTPEFIYLLRGKLFADYDNRELGISIQLVIKAIARAAGVSEDEVVNEFKKLGDLGSVASKVLGGKKKQKGLFESKLSVGKVMENLKKLPETQGNGAVDLKIGYIVDLLHSASAEEAKYIVRTVLGDLKIGVGLGILRDAVAVHCFKPEGLEDKKVCVREVQEAYDKATDMGLVFEMACKDELEKIKLVPGKPLKVMLFPKAKDVEDAFRIVGRPAAFEYKYDGFRVMVNKGDDGEVKVFTRALENVTKQFPEISEYVESHISADTFILDCEAVGFAPAGKAQEGHAASGKYTDFQAISQRIRRKYGIAEMREKLPIELVVFDVVYLDGESLIDTGFKKRREFLKGIVREEEWKIVLAKQIVTGDSSEVEAFYEKSLEDGQEGLMGRRMDAPYKPGARIGHAVKLKPTDSDFDLVITGAEWGTGKRAGWLTSFDIACRDEAGELLGIGKVSTGLKELKDEGLSFGEMTDMLEKLVLKVDGRRVTVKPEIVVSVQFQNVQRSPTNSSGFALRFPRILRLRVDRGAGDVATVGEVEAEVE